MSSFMDVTCKKKKMRSGIAKIIREVYPEAYEAYLNAFEKEVNLGDVIWAPCDDKIIGNMITQEFYGRVPNTLYVSYEAIQKGFAHVNEQVKEWGPPANIVAMPLIGAGLAQGDWAIISEIIEQESTNFQPVVYLLDGKNPLDN